jgi:hypothetical protein
LERGKRNMGWIEMVLKSDLIEMKETLAIQIPWPIILQKKRYHGQFIYNSLGTVVAASS